MTRERLVPAIDLLIPYAHWITPEVHTKRYDTQFYIIAAPTDHVAAHDTGELANLLWISPEQCIADGKAKKCQLEIVTRLNLSLLVPTKTVAEALAMAKTRNVIPILPRIDREAQTSRIPLEAGYGGDLFSFN